MSNFLFYSASQVLQPLRYSVQRGSKVYTWSSTAGMWTDKAIDVQYIKFSKNNDNGAGNLQRKFIAIFYVEDSHRMQFLEGIKDGIKNNAFPFYFTQEDGEIFRGGSFTTIEMIDMDAKNISETKMNRDITKARITIENYLDSGDITDFDNLCWSLDIPTVGKSSDELYLSVLAIANKTPHRILNKTQDNRSHVKDIVNRATKLKINGELMVYHDLHTNKYFCFDNPTQPFMNIDSIVDTLISDVPRFDSFSRKVNQVYEPFKKNIEAQTKQSPYSKKAKTPVESQKEIITVKPLVQESLETIMSKSEYENKMKEIITRIKDGEAKNSEDLIKKEINELMDYYVSSNKFSSKEKAIEIYDDVIDIILTNHKQKTKWMSGTNLIQSVN